jgi:hypothetical protein
MFLKKQVIVWECGKKLQFNFLSILVSASNSTVLSLSSTGADKATSTLKNKASVTTGMKNPTSNLNDVGGGTYTSYSSSGKGNGVKTSSVTPSNNMVTGMTSFAEDIEFSTLKTSIVIQPSAVALSKINSEIYSTAYFQTHFMASKMVGSIATGKIKTIFFLFSQRSTL